MPIESKEIILLLLGIVVPALLLTILRTFGIINLEAFNRADITIIITMILALGFIITIFYKRFGEITKEINIQELEQKKLGEKINIYERLAKIEAKVDEDRGIQKW